MPVTFVWSLGLRKRRGATDFWESWALKKKSGTLGTFCLGSSVLVSNNAFGCGVVKKKKKKKMTCMGVWGLWVLC